MKRLLSSAALMLCTVFSTFAQFSGSGSGTESDPYRIFNADQLTQMRNFLNQEGVYFKLQNDIDIAAWLTDNYPTQGWQPVGSSSEPFKGVLDGNGKTISGFSITRTTTDNVGLFAVVSGATIKNFTLKGDINGNAYVGSLFGSGSATVTDYTFEGTVTGAGNYIGGVGGSQSSTTSSDITVNATVKGSQYTGGVYGYGGGLTSATFTGQVTGTAYVGGLEGQGNGTFSSCTVNAPVKGASYTGGLVGSTSSSITIRNSTHRKNITGTTQTGGIIGGTAGGTVTLTSCYAEGDITGTTSVGGICGQINNPGSSSISGCNYWGNITGTSRLGGIVGRIATTYSSIDSTETTSAGRRGTYDKSNCFYKVSSPYFTTSGSKSGVVGTSNIIFSSDIKDWVKETTTIKYLVWKETANDGHGYTEGYYYESSCTAPCVVYNNILTDADANANVLVSLFNCSAVGNIFGTESYVGGIIGQDIVNNGQLAHYTQTDSKTIYYYAEGTNSTTALTLKKYNRSYTTTSIAESYFSGNLSGTNYVGGIAGTKQGGQINKCYASATINGGQYIGGIAGTLSKQSTNTNENSLNANVSICPSITGTSNVGRIYGSTDGNFSVAPLGTTSENRAMASMQVVTNGVTQTITDNLQNGTAVGVSQLRLKANYVAWGWDFNNYWTIQETESFPYKTLQSAPPTFSGKLTSGATTISGKSTDGGTVYLTTSSGKTYTTTCSGSNWSVSVNALHAGETVTAYAAGTNKKKSYFTTTTVGYLGSGTETDPYQIASAEDIQGIYTGGYYKIVKDINLTSWINQYSPTAGWLPVGYDGSAVYIDGEGHTISGLWTNSTGTYTGLFSKFKDGYIRNLNVEVASGKKVKGGSYTGILIANASNFEISNCSVKGNAEGTNYVGGLAGSFSGNSSSPNLFDLSYEGALSSATSGSSIGGIAGGLSYGEMTNASSVVQITSTGSNSYIGGLAGRGAPVMISRCKADNNITVSGTGSKTGGLVGTTSGGTTKSSTISESYSTGTIKVTGSDSWTGGIAGNISKCQLSDSYSTVTISGTQYTAGLVGKASGASEINRCYATGTVTGVYYGAGIVGYLNDTGTKTSNCVALNKILSFTDMSSWAGRVMGGYDDAAGDPDGSNLALATMQVSLNNLPVTKYDDLVEGIAKSEAELKQQATYAAMNWDFNNIWTMPAEGYPVLQWQVEPPSSVIIGDLTGDGKVSITDVVMIIDVIAGAITDANQKAAADVNGDGNISITDCVAAIDLIAAQGSSQNSARSMVRTMCSDNDFISGTMEDNVLTISLYNERRYTAFQMIVSVAEGMSLDEAKMNKMRGEDHQVLVHDLGSGHYLVAGFSSDNEELIGNSGNLLSIATNGSASGDIVISDIEFATTKAEAYYLADKVVSMQPTGIEGAQMSGNKDNIIFDLQGRRVFKPTKGVYIMNGKKILKNQ